MSVVRWHIGRWHVPGGLIFILTGLMSEGGGIGRPGRKSEAERQSAPTKAFGVTKVCSRIWLEVQHIRARKHSSRLL